MLHAGEVFEGYRIERLLGRGGMGSVYLAKHPRLPRHVALKLLNRDVSADDELRRRFEQEADVIARLDHPAVVNIFDRGVSTGHLWIAMQFVPGTDASSLNARTTTIQRATHIITETAAALDHAHSHGVLHRDVKPANILLAESETSEPERVVLTDFGIARLADGSVNLTATGTLTATLAYASPEQLSGEPLDPRSDQYSLACTLYALLLGKTPFADPNPAVVISGHLGRRVPLISPNRPDVPPFLDAVLARGMAKRREDRFSSCREFTAAVADALHGRVGDPARSAPTVMNWHQASSSAVAPPAEPPPLSPAVGPLPTASGRRRTRWTLMAAACIALVVAIGIAATVLLLDRAPSAPKWGATEQPIVAAFPGLVPGDGPGLNWLGSYCGPQRKIVDDDPTGKIFCTHNAPEPNLVLSYFDSVSDADAYVEQYIRDRSWDTRIAHRDMTAPALVSAAPAGTPLFKDFPYSTVHDLGDVYTRFPSDPTRSRFVVLFRSENFSGQEVIARWWSQAPFGK